MGGARAGQGGASGAASGGGGAGGNGGVNVAGSAAVASGGLGGSSAGSGGAGKAGSGGGGGIGSIVGALDGRFIEIACADSATLDDCSITGHRYDDTIVSCDSPRGTYELNFRLDHPIGGTPGATYLVTMHFYGILEPKNYGPNVTRESGSTRPQNLNTGANPAPWATAAPGVVIPPTTYGSNEVRVFDHTMTEVGAYFVNSDTQEDHYTYVIDYERTIPVVGGGFVRLASYDSNCRMIKNCGATAGAPCELKARSVTIPASIDPPLPADFEQPVGLTQYPSQWWLIDVTRVVPQ
jgi:hypothetical protein